MPVPPEWEIVPCPRERLADVLDLWRRAGAAPSVTDDLASLEVLLRSDPGALLVALSRPEGASSGGGELVGSLIAAWDGWRANFYRLAVAPPWRRRGLGGALVARGEERVRVLGARRLTAVVVEEVSPAVAFWTYHGYERQSSRHRFVRNV